MHYFIIINPISGIKHHKGDLELLIRNVLSRKKDAKVEVQYTKYAGHARELAQQAVRDKADIAVAVGGDGTMNEVAGGLVGTQTALGLIPMGSGNGFARSMGIPLKPVAAVKRLLNPDIKVNDVGQIGDFYFFGVAGVGFDAQIGAMFQDFGMRGPLPYFYIGFKEYFKYDYEEFELHFNGQQIRVRPLLITVANTPQYGNSAIIAPHARPDDGQFELCIIDKVPFWEGVTHLHYLFTGKIDRTSVYRSYPIKKATIVRTKQNGFLHTDGEPHHSDQKLEIKIQEKALKVCV